MGVRVTAMGALAWLGSILVGCADDVPGVWESFTGSGTSSSASTGSGEGAAEGTTTTGAAAGDSTTVTGPQDGTTSTDGTSTDDGTGSSSSGEPPPMVGYGDCFAMPPGLACLPQEICLTEADVYGVCSQVDCNGPRDCPPTPATGDAPVRCRNVDGVGDAECFLSCGRGETCPDGMACVAGPEGALCAWTVE